MRIATLIVILLFSLSVIFVLLAIQHSGGMPTLSAPVSAPSPASAPSSPAGSLPILWDAPPFAFSDQDEQLITEKDLLGHVWIANFIFTGCTVACPPMTAKMVILEKEVQDPGVRFVCFSVDPDHDTSAVLKHYAQIWNDGDPRWLLMRTDSKGLAAVAAGMKVAVMATGDQSNPIFHSSVFILVDREGHVRGVYNSNDNESIKQLASDTRLLAGDPAASSQTVSLVEADMDGSQLFRVFGCAACHSQPRIAPPLGRLAGKEIKLDDGCVVQADDTYLRESILDPGAKITAGYPNMMPSYKGHITDHQLDRLVNYLKTDSNELLVSFQAAMKEGTAMPATGLVDPVCRMAVKGSDKEPHAQIDGKPYYFCSDECLQIFLKNPRKYVKQVNTGAAPATQPN